MAKYKIDWSKIDDYKEEELKTMIECACRYLNSVKYPALEAVVAIIGIEEKQEQEEE